MRKYIQPLGWMLGLFAAQFSAAQDLMVTEVAPMPEAVTNNAVVEGIVGGVPYIYSFGGIGAGKTEADIHQRCYRYNTQTDAWENLPDLPDTLGKIAAAANRIGDIIYIIGGYHVLPDSSELSSDRVHRFDINTNTFLSDGAPVLIPIDDQTQAVWRDSLIYVVTGWSDGTNTSLVQIYNPTTDAWQFGTPVPNNGLYTSFGSSGVIIGDTIFYFGGARLGPTFPIQNNFRKGVINPADPTQITWTDTVLDQNLVGYRMAAVASNEYAFWIGGSEVTYNFDGIAYNGTGGVDPANRVILYNARNRQWTQNNAFTVPMDLRGAAQTAPFTWYLAGGMLAGQQVTDKAYRLQYDLIDGVGETAFEVLELAAGPNPATDRLQLTWKTDVQGEAQLRLFDLNGRLHRTQSWRGRRTEVSLAGLPAGVYLLEVQQSATTYSRKVVVE